MCPVQTVGKCPVSTAYFFSVVRKDICFISAQNVEVFNVSTVPNLKSQKSQPSQYCDVQVSYSWSVPKLSQML